MIVRNALTGAEYETDPGLKEQPKPFEGTDPRILVLDIETTPMNSWHWRCFKENISPKQVAKYSIVLCWVAKWLGEDTVIFDKGNGRTDKQLVARLWDLVDRADMVIAHNGIRFDMPMLNTRWAFHGMAPPSPYKSYDTLKVDRKIFKFPSNSLDGVSRYFKMGGKVQHEGMDLWFQCMKGDPDAWKRMEEYNIMDVLLLEYHYMKIRAWDKQHPNIALMYQDCETRCVVCGSRDLIELSEDATTSISRFQAYRCRSCGKPQRSGKRFKPDKEILRNIS
jgi:hypothetical protein